MVVERTQGEHSAFFQGNQVSGGVSYAGKERVRFMQVSALILVNPAHNSIINSATQ